MTYFSPRDSDRLPTFDAGGLDRRIVIEQRTVSQGDYGEPTETWTTFATVWAAVLPMTGAELAAAQQVSGEVITKFIIRYLSGILDTMRISYNSMYYDIFEIREMGRSHGLDIRARARQQ